MTSPSAPEVSATAIEGAEPWMTHVERATAKAQARIDARQVAGLEAAVQGGPPAWARLADGSFSPDLRPARRWAVTEVDVTFAAVVAEGRKGGTGGGLTFIAPAAARSRWFPRLVDRLRGRRTVLMTVTLRTGAGAGPGWREREGR